MKTNIVHCKKDKFDVLIDRTTKWGNIFSIGKDGTREEVIQKYTEWIKTQSHLMESLYELKDKVLGCWCSPQACHGDVLVKLVGELVEEMTEKKYFEFKCGCKFEQTNDDPIRIKFDPDISKIPLDCQKTWDLFKRGDTKGVFQLESRLGSSLSKKLKPENIEQLAALLSIMRPGALSAFQDGKSVTERYIDRKNGEEQVTYMHSALEESLKDTYGLMCIHEDTFISMSDGTEKYIKNIKSGDKLQSINEITNKVLKNDKCINVEKTRFEKGLNLRLENGFTITLTKDHKVFTNHGWIGVQHLDKKRHIVAIPYIQYNNKTESKHINELVNTSENSAYLGGPVSGDGRAGKVIDTGTLKNHKRVLKWLKNNTQLKLRPYFSLRSYYIGVSHPERADWKKLCVGNKKTKYNVWVDSLGLNLTKTNKNIHDCMFSTSDKNRHSFLAGLFDSDGYIGKGTNNGCIITFCSSNYKSINAVRKLLAIDGICTYI